GPVNAISPGVKGKLSLAPLALLAVAPGLRDLRHRERAGDTALHLDRFRAGFGDHRRGWHFAGLDPVANAKRVTEPGVAARRVEQHDDERAAADRRQHDEAFAGFTNVARFRQLDIP